MSSKKLSFTSKRKIRKSFSKIKEIAPMPNLIEVQRRSYESFLQMFVEPNNRIDWESFFQEHVLKGCLGCF